MNTYNAHQESNRERNQSGADLDDLIKHELYKLKNSKIILDYEVNVNYTHIGYSHKTQYLINFLIKTIDSKYIIVRSSNSFRSDRVKIPFYDLEGVLKNSSISDSIIASIFLVSDSEISNKTFFSTRDWIKNKTYYSPATHLFLLSEFIDFLNVYAYEIETQIDESLEVYDEGILSKDGLKESISADRGSFYGKEGNKFELDVVGSLNNISNLKKYKENRLGKETIFSTIINSIANDYKINQQDILSISASNQIFLNGKGGKPKTDIVVDIKLDDGKLISETVSIKNSTKKIVTCHDYTAADFIRVLDCEGTLLEKYLLHFQMYPTKTDFISNLPDGMSEDEFVKLLSDKKMIFTEWVLTGKHDDNFYEENNHISRYILIRQIDSLKFYSMADFISRLINSDVNNFGVPFHWTYPSKCRGKRIQLKVPLNV